MNNNMIIFKEFKTNEPGIWYFIPKNEKFCKRKSCIGFGVIKYGEGSIYTGDIYYDGKKFNKLGNGQQEFTYSTLGTIDPNINEKKYMFVGKYDYRKTDWIYGNGVLYYKDLNGNPSRFIKGFFSGLEKISEYHGEFDYSNLLDGYTKEMESDYSERTSLFNREKKNYEYVNKLDNLFIGDSYFEFWYYNEFSNNTFPNDYSLENNLNVGLGGSKFIDWYKYIPLLKDIQEPKNIIVNLGFNDLHSGFKPITVYHQFKKFINMLREIFPNSNYYILNVVHSPMFKDSHYELEIKFNEIMKKHAKENNITIIDNKKAIQEKEKEANCFHKDLVHLNDLGYKVMDSLIKENIK